MLVTFVLWKLSQFDLNGFIFRNKFVSMITKNSPFSTHYLANPVCCPNKEQLFSNRILSGLRCFGILRGSLSPIITHLASTPG
jgi:hypothetical protein